MELPATPERSEIKARGVAARRAEHQWILALYPVAWIALASLSSVYWFLPAGLRLGLLRMLPRRLWMRMAAVEWIAILTVSLTVGAHRTALATVLATVLPWLVYAAMVRVFGRQPSTEPTLQSMARLLLCGVAAALSNALLLSAIQWLDAGRVSRVGQSLFTYAVGDFVGILIVLPLLKILREQVVLRERSWLSLLAHGLVLLPVATLAALALLPMPAEARYPLIFASLPLYWLAIHCGWRPAAIAIALLSVGVYLLQDTLLAAWHPGQLQLMVVATGWAALLVGVAHDALHSQGRALNSTLEMLSTRSQALYQTAHRLTSQQEAERRRVGIELHDQVGQDMTAIATHVHLVERSVADTKLRNDLRGIARLVADAHGHLREVIDQLHPPVLERFGLARALAMGPIAEMIHRHGIDFRCPIHGEIDRLPPEVATAVYRICQEATSNGVRHGCGGRIHFIITLECRDDGADLTLRIEDDAGPIRLPAQPTGHGLQGIQDRAHALGASYRFNPESGNPRHWLYLRLPSLAVATRSPSENFS